MSLAQGLAKALFGRSVGRIGSNHLASHVFPRSLLYRGVREATCGRVERPGSGGDLLGVDGIVYRKRLVQWIETERELQLPQYHEPRRLGLGELDFCFVGLGFN